MNIKDLETAIRKIIPEAARIAAETVLLPAIRPAIPIDTGALQASLRAEKTDDGVDLLTGKAGDKRVGVDQDPDAKDSIEYAEQQFYERRYHKIENGRPVRILNYAQPKAKGLKHKDRYWDAYWQLRNAGQLERKRLDWYGPILDDPRNIDNFQFSLVAAINNRL